jgi:uncharacterized protein (DUF433 family)
MDWTDCLDVESKPGVMAGVPVVVGTRVPAISIVEHAESGYSAKAIVTEIFPSVPLSRAERIIDFARRHVPRAA